MFVVGPLGLFLAHPPKIVELVESVDPRWTFQTRRAESVGPELPWILEFSQTSWILAQAVLLLCEGREAGFGEPSGCMRTRSTN